MGASSWHRLHAFTDARCANMAISHVKLLPMPHSHAARFVSLVLRRRLHQVLARDVMARRVQAERIAVKASHSPSCSVSRSQAPTRRFRWRTAACCRWPTRLPRSAAATWWVCGSSGQFASAPPSSFGTACTTANMESVFSTVFPHLSTPCAHGSCSNAARLWSMGVWQMALQKLGCSCQTQKPPPATAATTATTATVIGHCGFSRRLPVPFLSLISLNPLSGKESEYAGCPERAARFCSGASERMPPTLYPSMDNAWSAAASALSRVSNVKSGL